MELVQIKISYQLAHNNVLKLPKFVSLPPDISEVVNSMNKQKNHFTFEQNYQSGSDTDDEFRPSERNTIILGRLDSTRNNDKYMTINFNITSNNTTDRDRERDRERQRGREQERERERLSVTNPTTLTTRRSSHSIAGVVTSIGKTSLFNSNTSNAGGHDSGTNRVVMSNDNGKKAKIVRRRTSPITPERNSYNYTYNNKTINIGDGLRRLSFSTANGQIVKTNSNILDGMTSNNANNININNRPNLNNNTSSNNKFKVALGRRKSASMSFTGNRRGGFGAGSGQLGGSSQSTRMIMLMTQSNVPKVKLIGKSFIPERKHIRHESTSSVRHVLTGLTSTVSNQSERERSVSMSRSKSQSKSKSKSKSHSSKHSTHAGGEGGAGTGVHRNTISNANANANVNITKNKNGKVNSTSKGISWRGSLRSQNSGQLSTLANNPNAVVFEETERQESIRGLQDLNADPLIGSLGHPKEWFANYKSSSRRVNDRNKNDNNYSTPTIDENGDMRSAFAAPSNSVGNGGSGRSSVRSSFSSVGVHQILPAIDDIAIELQRNRLNNSIRLGTLTMSNKDSKDSKDNTENKRNDKDKSKNQDKDNDKNKDKDKTTGKKELEGKKHKENENEKEISVKVKGDDDNTDKNTPRSTSSAATLTPGASIIPKLTEFASPINYDGITPCDSPGNETTMVTWALANANSSSPMRDKQNKNQTDNQTENQTKNKNVNEKQIRKSPSDKSQKTNQEKNDANDANDENDENDGNETSNNNDKSNKPKLVRFDTSHRYDSNGKEIQNTTSMSSKTLPSGSNQSTPRSNGIEIKLIESPVNIAALGFAPKGSLFSSNDNINKTTLSFDSDNEHDIRYESEKEIDFVQKSDGTGNDNDNDNNDNDANNSERSKTRPLKSGTPNRHSRDRTPTEEEEENIGGITKINTTVHSVAEILHNLKVSESGHVAKKQITYLFGENGKISRRIILPQGLPVSRLLLEKETLFEQMNALYEKYVKPGSLLEINISSQMRGFLHEFFEKPKQYVTKYAESITGASSGNNSIVNTHGKSASSITLRGINKSLSDQKNTVIKLKDASNHPSPKKDSKLNINIDSIGTIATSHADTTRIASNYLTKLNRLAFNVFDQSAIELLNLLKQSYYRFKRTEQFEQYMAKLEKTNSNSNNNNNNNNNNINDDLANENSKSGKNINPSNISLHLANNTSFNRGITFTHCSTENSVSGNVNRNEKPRFSVQDSINSFHRKHKSISMNSTRASTIDAAQFELPEIRNADSYSDIIAQLHDNYNEHDDSD